MTEQATPDEQATPQQLEQLRALAKDSGEEVPETMPASEASQRIVELRADS